MKKYEVLTKYIPYIDEDKIGQWIIDRENDGTLEHPKQFRYANFVQIESQFADDVNHFVSAHPDLDLINYRIIIESNGIKWDIESMSGAIIEDLDGRCICALLVAAVRADHFCGGLLGQFFRNGSISRWLHRLQEFDFEEIK